jgi:diacylglycerol kinase (ATP)
VCALPPADLLPGTGAEWAPIVTRAQPARDSGCRDEFTAVVNPRAGRGTGLVVAQQLGRELPEGALDVVCSRDPRHAHELAEQACRSGRTVLAVGGDGHVGCVADAVVAAGGVLGIVPVGRGNDFARQLGLPRDPAALARVIVAGRRRMVDVLHCGGRVVLGSVYAGVDSVANAIVNSHPGFPASVVYRYAAVRALLTFEPVGFRLVLDGDDWVERAYCVVIANSGFYGGGMHIVPTAEVDDELIDVLVVRASSRLSLIAALRSVYSGTHIDRSDVEVRRAREVELTADRSVPVHGDGELVGSPPVTVEIRGSALPVLVGH